MRLALVIGIAALAVAVYALTASGDEPTAEPRPAERAVVAEKEPEVIIPFSQLRNGISATAMRNMAMPSLMSGASSSPYSFAGSAVGGGATAVGGGRYDTIAVDVRLDSNTVERLVFEGIALNVRRGNLTDIRR